MVHVADIIQHPIDRQYKQTSYVFCTKVHANAYEPEYSFPSTQILKDGRL